MGPIQLANLGLLMERTSGSPKIKIGLIDGPVDTQHPQLLNTNIRTIGNDILTGCISSNSAACMHGTFVAGILSAARGTGAPGICPDCTLLVRPVFAETINGTDPMPAATPHELSTAIIDCIDAGAQILNLSLAIAHPSVFGEQELLAALNYAAKKGAIVIAAAGNQGSIGSTDITRHPWTIPVVAVNAQASPLQQSNLGGSIGRQGLSAPGENITGIGPGGVPATFTGTSAATPFVTGTIALLWSLFQHLSASAIKAAITQTGSRKTIVPPVINAQALFNQFTKNSPVLH